ncbi:MAG: hypothetical protein HOV81_41385 [Kofleriaceae bacterium]|nr:hypothetical protein [Kofleriaceae bacterium]
MLCFVASCTASADSALPPDDDLFFPTAIAISPDETALFVVNANSDLRYNSGTLSVLDLDQVDRVVESWVGEGHEIAADCTQDLDHRETLICRELQFIRPDAGARFGSFATTIAVQTTGDGRARLIIPTRGDPSITWMDWDGSRVHCSEDDETFALCDDAHRLTAIHDDPDLGTLPEEPFGVAVSSDQDFAIVTHHTTGYVTLVDSPRGGAATIADVTSGLFAYDDNGYVGASGVAIRSALDSEPVAYVGSQYESRIQTLTVGRSINEAPPFLVPGPYFFLDGVGGYAGLSSDTRGVTFNAAGDRFYTLNRNPPSVQMFDTSTDETGAIRNSLLDAEDICRNAGQIALVPTATSDIIYVTCFQDGQLYVVEAANSVWLTDIITVGRGPYDLVAAPGRGRIYVTNFLEETIAVIDTKPDSPTRNRVVLKIAEPTTP